MMLEDPDAVSRWEGVMAREKMSVGWASGSVRVWRYCFDCDPTGTCEWRFLVVGPRGAYHG